MKARTLSVLAGLSAPLILSGSSDAGFVGIKVVGKDNPFGILVCNVYAIFDRPGEDRMEAVAGTPNTPLQIDVIGGTFYNTPNVGSDYAPSTFLISIFPSLAYDSFVTIGVKAVGTAPGAQPKDNMSISPGYPPPVGEGKFTTESGYGIASIYAQGDPFDPVNSFPGNGQIIIGQFSTANGTGISGSFLIQYTSNGVQFQQSAVSFFHVPGPGALALLATAALLGTRRRR